MVFEWGIPWFAPKDCSILILKFFGISIQVDLAFVEIDFKTRQLLKSA
jgi:hypothetical protein